MCRITGSFNCDSYHPADRDVLVAMTDAVAHLGADAAGDYQAPGIGLRHPRLGNIDLSTGDQPLTSHDGIVQVVFKGEIYNSNIARSCSRPSRSSSDMRPASGPRSQGTAHDAGQEWAPPAAARAITEAM